MSSPVSEQAFSDRIVCDPRERRRSAHAQKRPAHTCRDIRIPHEGPGLYAETVTTPPPQPPQPPYGGGSSVSQPLSPADEKLWATLVHIGGIFFSFLPALIGFLVLKDRGPFVRAHTATALNFQITVAIAFAVGGILSIIGIGLLIMLAAWIVDLVFSIIAAVKANQGEWYTYPLAIKFVS